LWKLLPFALGSKDDLTGLGRVDEKKKFMSEHHVDFIDVIAEVEVPADREDDVDDAFIDKYVKKCHDVISEMKNLTLDAACFTRSTFGDIPRINSRIIEIEDYCKKSNIQFRRLVTPSPGYRPKDKQLKQREWTEFFEPFAKS
jgi:hypothetical protein